MTVLSFRAFDSLQQKQGYFLFMPGRKMADGTYVDIVHPLNDETRQMIQKKVVEEYEKVANESLKRQVQK
jgi:stage V sporulation protein G